MKIYELAYNPYTVETKLSARKASGELLTIGKESKLAPIFHQRMQRWLAPSGSWKGFFAELKEMCGEDHIKIRFTGTEEDYKDLLNACRRYTPELHFAVDLENTLSKLERIEARGDNKLMRIQHLISDAQENADTTVLPQEILDYLKHALDPSFEINVMAPVSAGKSTLQNALIGRRLLPTSNEAKTAVLTRTRINNGASDFRAESLLHDGTRQIHSEFVCQKFINTLNDEIDPNDPSKKSALRDEIYLEGPSPQFEDCDLDLVFVDTPGGNNAMNMRHKQVMQKALLDENKNVILFVFSEKTINHENTMDALKETAEVMKIGSDGKINQDRFLFVCTGCDTIPSNLDNTEKSIRQVLSSCGITEPNLFMVSALAVELLRTEEYNQRMVQAGRRDCLDRLSADDKNKLNFCVDQLAILECDLYAHAAVPDDYKVELGKEIQKWKDAYWERKTRLDDAEEGYVECSPEEESTLRKEASMIGRRIAMLNSGIPGLEYAIREYLNRYAIPMKIQQAVSNIKAKAEQVDMCQKAAQRWTDSQEAAKAAMEEAEMKMHEFKRSEKLRNDKERLSAMKLDKNAIINKTASCVKKLENLPAPKMADAKYMEMNGKKGEWIREDVAQWYLDTVNKSLKNDMDSVVEDMADYFNKIVVQTCNDILNDYRQHINDLQKKGLFNLAGLDIAKIIPANPNISQKVNVSQMVAIRNEVVGTKQVAKKGFWNGVIRFFGGTGGYETVNIYGNVKYVFVLDLYTTQRAKIINAFNKWSQDETKRLEKRLEVLRADVARRMKNLDNFIAEIYDEYMEKLSDTKKLVAEAKELQAQSQWLEDFMKKVDQLLVIGSNVSDDGRKG